MKGTHAAGGSAGKGLASRLVGAWLRRRGGVEGRFTLAGGRPLPAIRNEGSRILLQDVVIHPAVRLWANRGGVLRAGEGTVFMDGAEVVAWREVTIGRGVVLGPFALVMDTDLHEIPGGRLENRPVVIGDGALIGARAIILKGVTIGAGARVAPGCLVVRDVPDGAWAGGGPARVLKILEEKPNGG